MMYVVNEKTDNLNISRKHSIIVVSMLDSVILCLHPTKWPMSFGDGTPV